MSSTKRITFRYFDVEYKGLTSSSSLVARLSGKLTSSAKDRMMPLNKQESSESDLISDFSIGGKNRFIMGTMLRIVQSSEAPIITDDMLKQESFKVSSINSEATEREKTCLDFFYFCMSDEHIVVTLKSNKSINRLETYVNWILDTSESGEHVSFNPEIDVDSLSAADIKKITVGSSFDFSVKDGSPGVKGEVVKTKLLDVTSEVFNTIFLETASLDDLMNANICSANLIIKFTKPRGMDEDEYKRKTAGAILKPLENPNNITFQGKEKRIKGSSVLKTEEVEVECLENGAVSEQEVYQKMLQKLLNK